MICRTKESKQWDLPDNRFAHLCVRLPIHPPSSHSLILSFTPPLHPPPHQHIPMHLLAHPDFHSLVHPLTHPFNHPLTLQLTHPPNHPPIHPLTTHCSSLTRYSLTHPPTHSFAQPVILSLTRSHTPLLTRPHSLSRHPDITVMVNHQLSISPLLIHPHSRCYTQSSGAV